MKRNLKTILNSRIVSLLKVLVFIGICVGIGIFTAYYQHANNPTDEAAKYFRAFIARDYETMYNCLYKKEGYYISKQMYISQMKKIRGNYIIDSYTIGKPEKDGHKKKIVVTCVDDVSGNKQDFIVNLIGKRKGLSIAPDYYVDIEKMLVKNFTVTINEGCELLLNNEKITDKDAAITPQDGVIKYNFEAILNGAYSVVQTAQYYSANENITLNRVNTKIDMTKSKVTASNTYKTQLQKMGKDVIEQFFSAVRERKADSKDLMKYFETKELKKKVKKYVKKSQKMVYPPETKNIDKYKVTEMDIKDYKENISYSSEKNNYVVEYSFYYKYKAETAISLANSYVYSLKGKTDCSFKITYSIKDSKIAISDIVIKSKKKK